MQQHCMHSRAGYDSNRFVHLGIDQGHRPRPSLGKQKVTRMGIHYLSRLFTPRSVAVFGASDHLESVGGTVFRNMLQSNFKGKLFAINPAHTTVQGVAAHASLASIQAPIDLAVICTHAKSVPDILEACGTHGIRGAVVLSAGFGETGAEGKALEQAMLAVAAKHGIRIIGPNCLGIIQTQIGLNATFFKGDIRPGNLALVSQSGALCTAILDYAPAHDIGFSNVISMGASVDVDFGEVLDYLVTDPRTQSILLYVEGIHKARNFMSALRQAARNKPVFVIKVGRHAAGSKAVSSHTGAMVGSDAVFDAAIRRAGAVRVRSIGGLFSAAKSLASHQHFTGQRLAVITNGGGPGVMAIDRAADLGVDVATFSDTTIAKLNAVLPSIWSHNNPVDIIGDATPERYKEAILACLADNGVDAVLVILTPQAMTAPLEVAQAIIAIANTVHKPLLTCWMGDVQINPAREAFIHAKVPTFRTPEGAVEAFSYMTAYYRNQRLLEQTADAHTDLTPGDVEFATRLIETALEEGRTVLSELESKQLLSAFGIPTVPTVIASTLSQALESAKRCGYPVAMKIHSPEITHKSDCGGVALNIESPEQLETAFIIMMGRVKANHPHARIIGVTVQPMIRRPHARELMVGVATDAVFGPVISFGIGGVMVEVLNDHAIALPPLNDILARELIQQTRAAKLIKAFRHMPAVDDVALEQALLRVSEMVCKLPWLKELDINPLIADEKGVLALDARVVIGPAPHAAHRYAHLAIYPYPDHLIKEHVLRDGTPITIRPIRPEDAKIQQAFVQSLSEETKYFRYMSTINELSHAMMIRFTQIDYDREMALIAVTMIDHEEVEVGVCRYAMNPDGQSCEFAVVVSDAWQHKSIAHTLMNNLFNAAREKGLKTMEGEVLANNYGMLELMTSLGFTITTSPDDHMLKDVVKQL